MKGKKERYREEREGRNIEGREEVYQRVGKWILKGVTMKRMDTSWSRYEGKMEERNRERREDRNIDRWEELDQSLEKWIL